MYAGQIVEVASARAFFSAPKHPYARLLLQSMPGALQRGSTLAAIAGTVPSLSQPFTGCRFAPRCDRLFDRCRHEAPAMQPAEEARAVAPAVATPPGPAGGPVDRLVRCWLYADGDRGPGPRPVSPASASASAAAAGKGAAIDGRAAAESGPAGLLLDVQNLGVKFPQRSGLLQRTTGYSVAVADVSLQIRRGETLALVGESGCGKTTIGKAIVQLLRGQAVIEGRALLDGVDLFSLRGEALRRARRSVQMIFQDPYASLNPRLRVHEALEEGLLTLRPELDAAARRRLLESLIVRVGLSVDALQRHPHEFSGGQRQRLAIARALAVEPALIVCDEPTSALDVSVQAQILNLLRSLQHELGLSYLFITHHLGVVEYLADRVAVMRHGRLVEAGPTMAVLGDPQQAFTRQLMAAVPRVEVE